MKSKAIWLYAVATVALFVASGFASSIQNSLMKSGKFYPGEHWDPAFLFSLGCVFLGAMSADAAHEEVGESQMSRTLRLVLKHLSRGVVVTMVVAMALSRYLG